MSLETTKARLHREQIMTRSFIVRTVIVNMVALTFMSGVTQAQSPAGSNPAPAAGEGAAELNAEALLGAEFVDPNRFFTGVCTIGPRAGDVLFRCFNLGFTNPSPRLVLCQTRNHPAEFVNYSDQFACQVIGTNLQDNGSVWVRIRRMDDGTTSSSWGQNLQINLLIVN